MTRVSTSLFLVIAMTIAFASQASAQGAIEIGGRDAVTGNFSLITNNPDVGDTTTSAIIAGTLTRTTADSRWEYGGGLSVFASDAVTIVTPSAQGRYNFDFMGPEENLLPYVGGIVGIAFVDIDGFGTDTLGAFGGKVGVEFYFSSDVALQLEDILVVDTDSGVTNNLTIGVKYLF